MLKFIHGYDERYLPGLVKHGLLNKNSGIKICQHFPTPENEKFNILAAKGGKLYQLVKENGFLFYIDRLQGGTYYSKYDFDRALLREYCDMLGQWFLGIQMHEWAAGRKNDWIRIRKQLAGTPPPWTEQQIHDAIKAVSSCKWCIHLAQGTAYEYSQQKYSETWQEYIEELRQLFKLRQDETGGLLLPCDAFVMATAMEYKLGARSVMPEVGAGIFFTRLQVAIARGMSNALGRPWGIYYAPWGGEPFSAPHFFETALNEWRMDNTIFLYDFTAQGPNGGSSRAWQRRIYYYALMAGACFIGEEWGVSNTFYNWRDYPLTPYGEIKKDFIDFAEKCPCAEPFVPFALVLPGEFEVVDLSNMSSPEAKLYLKQTIDGSDKASFDHIKMVLRLIYARDGKIFGNEGASLTNSRFGDFFDVIYEDAGEQAFSKYACLVDASSAGGFAKSVSGKKHRVLESRDMEMLEHNLVNIIETDFPCNVYGGVHWLLSRSGDKWILTMFNNEGVERSVEKGDYLLDEAKIEVSIRFKKEPEKLRILKSWPGVGALERQAACTYCCTIPAGGFYIMEFHPK